MTVAKDYGILYVLCTCINFINNNIGDYWLIGTSEIYFHNKEYEGKTLQFSLLATYHAIMCVYEEYNLPS